MTALRSGEYLPPQDDGYDPNADMRALQSSHKRKAKEADTYMNREQLMELRKVQAERVEVPSFRSCPGCRGVWADFYSLGWEDETAWDGHQTKHGCAHGRHSVRRVGLRHGRACRPQYISRATSVKRRFPPSFRHCCCSRRRCHRTSLRRRTLRFSSGIRYRSVPTRRW